MIEEISNIFNALSDEKRLRILKLLDGGELCVCDIVNALGESQPKVSFHLGVLKSAGLIRDKRHGRWTLYRFDDRDIFRRFLILSAIERISDEEIKEDRERLKEFLKKKECM
jgi:ArsR family transcriptional regulator